IYLPTGAVDDDTLSEDNQAIMQGVRVTYPAVLGGAPLLANGAAARATQSFINRYTQQFGSFSGCAPYAADALALVAAAVRRASSVDPRRLRGALESTPYEGVAGAYGFSPIDHGGMSPDVLAMFVAQRRTWVRL
ncbi:MAG: ABC transporter substrate-binding protein, partial [Catenulispora sp.]|nr:ABC transporter substrate-binding protein [Catenulispora sp.]